MPTASSKKNATSDERCLNHPSRAVHARGLCPSCYQTLQRLIRQGKMTDRRAVKQSMMLPRLDGWPGNNNPRRIKPFPRN